MRLTVVGSFSWMYAPPFYFFSPIYLFLFALHSGKFPPLYTPMFLLSFSFSLSSLFLIAWVCLLKNHPTLVLLIFFIDLFLSFWENVNDIKKKNFFLVLVLSFSEVLFLPFSLSLLFLWGILWAVILDSLLILRVGLKKSGCVPYVHSSTIYDSHPSPKKQKIQ